MAPRDSVIRVEAAVAAAGYTLRQRGADVYRTQGICHGGRSSESLVFLYNPDRGHINPHCHANCDRGAVLDALGLAEGDLYDEPRGGSRTDWSPRPARPVISAPEPRIYPAKRRGWRPLSMNSMRCRVVLEDGSTTWETHRLVAEYLYANADSCVAFGVCRCEHKHFAQWRPDPAVHDGRRWGIRERDERGNIIATVPALPYMLPQVLAGIAADRTIWITEGERDARTLVSHGLVATCNAEGAGKWTSQHAAYLAGADVTIVADRDAAGRKHAQKVVETLMPIAHSVEVVQARHGKDASDHLDAGGTITDFIPVWEPKPFAPKEAA
jgi:hypothetical protein